MFLAWEAMGVTVNVIQGDRERLQRKTGRVAMAPCGKVDTPKK